MLKPWFDFRAVGLATLLALVAALPLITTSVERRDYYFFDITLTSSSVGNTQFFWDFGQGFSEYNSSRQPIKIESAPVVYRFMMPMGRFTAFRFDPIDGIGSFTFTKAQIVDLKGHVLHVFKPEDFIAGANVSSLKQNGATIEVSTDPASHDPALYFKLDQPFELRGTLRIWAEQGLPVALPVFILGLLLGLPAVARRLSTAAIAIGNIAQQYPVSAIMVSAGLAVAIQCHPVIFQGRSFVSANNGGHMLYDTLPTLPGDTDPMSTNTGSSDTGAMLFQHLYYPMVQRDALAAGDLPLWNRYSLCGEPLLGQGQSMFGDPFNFLTIAADGAAWAWDLRFILAHWILAAALGGIVWMLTRHLGAAALTALAGAFLGFFTFRLTHPANFSVCYSPLILLAWTGLHTAFSPRRLAGWLLALVAANWTVMMSGTVKEAYMLMVGLNFAGVLLLWWRPEAEGNRRRVLIWATAAGFTFILLSAPGWVSFLSAWSHSMTGYDTPQADTLRWSHFIGFFDDMFYRQTHKDENVVAPALNFLFFTGALWMLVQPRAWRGPRIDVALFAAALPPLALAFGLIPKSIIVKIPFVGNIVHVGNTFSCVLMIIVAVYAGLGFRDAWNRLKHPDAMRVIVRVWIAGLALAGVYFLTSQGFPKSPFFSSYAIGLGVAAAALPLGLHWGLLSPRSPGPLWIVLLIGIPLLCWRHMQFRETKFENYTFAPGPRSDFHGKSPAVDLVNTHKVDTGRVVGWNSALYASYNTALRWEGMYGVDAVRSRHFQEIAAHLGLKRVWDWDTPNRETDSRDLVRKYDTYNVTHYVAAHREGAHPIDGVNLIGQADLDVYESPTAWPRAFYVDRAVSYAGPSDMAQLIEHGDRRPFAAVQQGDVVPVTAANTNENRVVRAARDYNLEPNRTTFTLDAPAKGIAVLLETYYLNDFEVTVNGRPADYFRVNHAFKGVEIPAAGTYIISFNYWPQYFTTALWAGLGGLIFLIAGLVWLWLRPTFSR